MVFTAAAPAAGAGLYKSITTCQGVITETEDTVHHYHTHIHNYGQVRVKTHRHRENLVHYVNH